MSRTIEWVCWTIVSSFAYAATLVMIATSIDSARVKRDKALGIETWDSTNPMYFVCGVYLSPLVGLGCAAVLMSRRRRPERPIWQCEDCGYDLNKNESGVCPECGAKVHWLRNLPMPPRTGQG